MRVLVISLRSSQARRDHVRREMAAAAVPFRFFDAIEGDSGRSHFSKAAMLRYWINSRRAPLPGEIGCYASHLAVWRYCVRIAEPVLVLEDDFTLSPGFGQALVALDALTREFGFIRLETIHRRRASACAPRSSVHRIRNEGPHALYYLSEIPLCMLAYTIGPTAAARLVEASQQLTAPVDKFMQRTWEHGVPLFGIAPPLVGTAPLSVASTIGHRSRKTWNLPLLILRSLDKILGRIQRWRFNSLQLRRLRASAEPTQHPEALSAGP